MREPDGREVGISGLLSEQPDADTLVIMMHGCGGTPRSHYMIRNARDFYRAGYSVLRLAWRGADGSGEDFYHAAQTAELHAAIASPDFARYRRIWLLGFSLGGHCVLHAVCENRDQRIKAAATVCPVLHLIDSNLAIDGPERAFYRRHVLAGLIQVYTSVAARRGGPAPIERVRKAATFREFDALTVVPRYGFASVDDYYASACASRVLGAIDTPTLVLVARHDPMLPWEIGQRLAPRMSDAVAYRVSQRGGHTGFPSDLDLGERAAPGLASQLQAWFERQG